jgi:hypothetical protein
MSGAGRDVDNRPMRMVRAKGPRRLVPSIVAFALGALLAAPAARADTTSVVPFNGDLTMPAGLVRDNAGSIWVTDALLGVCKVDAASHRLVQDGAWCGGTHAGPVAAFQLAFDPASSSLFVAEGSSHSSGVWRLTVNPATDTISAGTKIVADPDRVFGLALGNDGGTPVIDYTTKRLNIIHRILNPATCSPCSSTTDVGSAMTAGPTSLARVGNVLYIAESVGVTRIADASALGQVATPVPGFPGGIATAVAADLVRGRVYAGTTNGPGLADQVAAMKVGADGLPTGSAETYVSGLSAVGALFADADGSLLVGDAPGPTPDVPGNGRLQSASLVALGRPVAKIVSGPGTFSAGHSASWVVSGPTGSTFECRLDAPNDATPWTACGAAPSATVDSASLGKPTLGEGSHTFEVRAVSPDPTIGVGPVQKAMFIVDTSAPTVFIDNAASDADITGAQITMRFSSSDGTAAFSCSMDGSFPAPCSDPKTYTGVGPGFHVFTVTARDQAGNTSAAQTFGFTMHAPAAPASQPAPGPDSRSIAPAPEAPAPAPEATWHFTSSLRAAAMRLIRPHVHLRKLFTGRRIVTEFTVPAGAHEAQISLYRTNRRSVDANAKPTALVTLKLEPGKLQHLALTLSRRQGQRLRTGHYLVGVLLTDGADHYGPSRFSRLTVLR